MPVGHFPQVKSPDLKANIQYVWGENPPCNANMHICIIPVSPNMNYCEMENVYNTIFILLFVAV